MDQITAFFENINWDNVMQVVSDYVTKIEIKSFADNLWATLQQLINIIAGDLLGGILG